MSNFLTASDMNRMQLEFNKVLNSPEACDISIQYKLPAEGATTDAVYGTTITTGWRSYEIPARAIQNVIHARNSRVLDWGILEVGDSVFYISTEVDLSKTQNFENTIIVANQVTWIPVNRKLREFYNYMNMQFGNGQLGQVIPAKIKQ